MVMLADKLLVAFDRAVSHDQGNTYRRHLQQVLPHIGDANRQDDDKFRSHMGASQIGTECARAIWYSWRWATAASFSGQVLRLFNRGHLEEARFIALLLSAGVAIYQQDAEGKQFRVSAFGGHFGGSGDGVGVGIPDLPAQTAALLECKTHNDKSFKELAGLDWAKYIKSLLDPNLPRIKFTGKGVREAKFEHYVQMQIYLRGMNLPVALYLAVNKNDDHIYAELVPVDHAFADTYYERAHKIIPMVEAPKRISNSPGWFGCQWCDHKPVCHLKQQPERNCRTCSMSAPREDGTWFCGMWNETRDKQAQLIGCSEYEQHPEFKK
jgi:hypothetical protein